MFHGQYNFDRYGRPEDLKIEPGGTEVLSALTLRWYSEDLSDIYDNASRSNQLSTSYKYKIPEAGARKVSGQGEKQKDSMSSTRLSTS